MKPARNWPIVLLAIGLVLTLPLVVQISDDARLGWLLLLAASALLVFILFLLIRGVIRNKNWAKSQQLPTKPAPRGYNFMKITVQVTIGVWVLMGLGMLFLQGQGGDAGWALLPVGLTVVAITPVGIVCAIIMIIQHLRNR